MFSHLMKQIRSAITNHEQKIKDEKVLEPVQEKEVKVKKKLSSFEFQKPKRKVNRVFIHCSASDHPKHDDISVIKDWHVNGNGWKTVGYHYFIKSDGTIQAGRPLSQSPASQYPENTGTISVCLHGLKIDKFTKDQFDSLREMCDVINKAYEGNITFHGHREVANRDCPVFDYKKVLNLDSKGKLI